MATLAPKIYFFALDNAATNAATNTTTDDKIFFYTVFLSA